jgi:hypothetical protein
MQGGAGRRKSGAWCRAGRMPSVGAMQTTDKDPAPQDGDVTQKATIPAQKPGEVGGPKGPEPTRYGDWEVGGRCTDF